LYSDTIDKYLGEIRQKEKERESGKADVEKEMEALEKELANKPEEDEVPVSPKRGKRGKK
jgi:hypothetical protein